MFLLELVAANQRSLLLSVCPGVAAAAISAGRKQLPMPSDRSKEEEETRQKSNQDEANSLIYSSRPRRKEASTAAAASALGMERASWDRAKWLFSASFFFLMLHIGSPAGCRSRSSCRAVEHPSDMPSYVTLSAQGPMGFLATFFVCMMQTGKELQICTKLDLLQTFLPWRRWSIHTGNFFGGACQGSEHPVGK